MNYLLYFPVCEVARVSSDTCVVRGIAQLLIGCNNYIIYSFSCIVVLVLLVKILDGWI